MREGTGGETVYRFLVIEDDSAAAARLRTFVERYLAEHGIEASIDWLKTAFEFIELKQRYDLVFMDINLPGINGMDAAGLLRKHDSETLIVFVTDLAKYAVKGYEVDALDFIVKPVTYQGLALRMDRVMRALAARPSTNLVVNGREGISVFPMRDLLYVAVSDHYLAYHLANGTQVLARETMRSFCQSHTQPQLVQISSGYVVNADNVRSIRGQEVQVSNGDILVISRPKRRAAMEAFARYYGGA